MNHRIVPNFKDGITYFIHVASDEAAVDAAYHQGINIPLGCHDGVCGTCKCLAEIGCCALDQDYVDDALSAEEAIRGYVLTYQMHAESNCVPRVPASSTLCRTGQARYGARVSEARQPSPSIIGLSLHGEALASLASLPGQYVNLQVSGSEWRHAYSFSSLTKDDEVSFLIHNVPGGLMSGFLSGTARVGDSLTMDGPLGSFYPREVHRSLLMLADGIGLASFAAMLERVVGQGSAHPLYLVYGVIHDIDLVGLKCLEVFAEWALDFTWSACVTSADSDYPRKDYVTEHIVTQHLYEGDVDVYLYEPSPMVEMAEHYLREQDVRPMNLYYEKFATSAA